MRGSSALLIAFSFCFLAQSAFGFGWGESESRAKRSGRIGLGLPLLVGNAFSGEASGSVGFSIGGVYELHFTPKFVVGLPLNYRSFSGDRDRFTQLGYGLLLRHYFSAPETRPRPYFEYGLLQNVSRISGTSGSGTSHDTKLGGGVDFAIGELPFFADLAFHISRLRFFESPSANLDYMQLSIGYRIGR